MTQAEFSKYIHKELLLFLDNSIDVQQASIHLAEKLYPNTQKVKGKGWKIVKDLLPTIAQIFINKKKKIK